MVGDTRHTVAHMADLMFVPVLIKEREVIERNGRRERNPTRYVFSMFRALEQHVCKLSCLSLVYARCQQCPSFFCSCRAPIQGMGGSVPPPTTIIRHVAADVQIGRNKGCEVKSTARHEPARPPSTLQPMPQHAECCSLPEGVGRGG